MIVWLSYTPAYAQEPIPIAIGTYRTALASGQIGDWGNPASWQVWNGEEWNPAILPPNQNHDVFILQYNEIRLTQLEEARTLYLFSGADPGRKLNLQDLELQVYGALRGFSLDEDGIYVIDASVSPLLDWIYPEQGRIVFKGESRTVVDRSSWSAQNQFSRYTVVFDPDSDAELVVNSAFKANAFIVQSGTVSQTVNMQGTPVTSTFSFNIHDNFGVGAYGEFIIEPGATLKTASASEFGQVVRRTSTRAAATFHLKQGGTLVLLGQDPVIDAESILLEGDVYYSLDTGSQQFISGSLAGISDPVAYYNLFFSGGAIKHLPTTLSLFGNLTFLGGGALHATSTTLSVVGGDDQNILNVSYAVGNMQINKPSGVLYVNEDLFIDDRLTMTGGNMDFMNNQLFINQSGDGGLSYVAGGWENLATFHYSYIPASLNLANSTFPFVDRYLGGLRKIFLSGSNSTANGGLIIDYHQLPEVNWDPNFYDYDNTLILYKLNSYFNFQLTNVNETDPWELRISADELVVDHESDLRIVSDLEAASGIHLPGLQDGGYLARRSLTPNEMNNETFTIGSTGITSILPVTWLSLDVEETLNGNLIHWSTSRETENWKFVILKSEKGDSGFEEVGEVVGQGNSNMIQNYSFLDKGVNAVEKVYYQIKQVDIDGSFDFSDVISLTIKNNSRRWEIYPNPFTGGELIFSVPDLQKHTPAYVVIQDTSGRLLGREDGQLGEASRRTLAILNEALPGTYFISVVTDKEKRVLKWVKVP